MFDDTRLPIEVERGAVGGPRFQTSVTVMATGREQRNSDWPTQRGAWEIAYGIQTKTDFATVLAFFYARQGKARGFRFRDWSDYQATSEIIGTGTGAQTDFQLIKSYTSLVTYARKITRPVTGTVAVTVNGVTAAFTLQPLGIIRLNVAAPAAQIVRATYEFDVPVRFDTDEFRVALETFDAGAIQSLPLVEVRE
jgi:uncharacterized protein (TIGR02217 family)